jgi:hypothetical protein
VFLAEKHSTDAGQGSDRRWRRVCRLTLEDGLWRRGVRRVGVRATDTDVSVYRSHATEAAKDLAATDAELRLSLDRARERCSVCHVYQCDRRTP